MRKILEVFVFFVLTCFTSIWFIGVLNSAASGRSKGKNKAARLEEV